MMRLLFLVAGLGITLFIIVPLHAQTKTSITSVNAHQLVELGRANFLLEPAIAPAGLDLSPDGEQLVLATDNGVYLVSVGDFLHTGFHPGAIGSAAIIMEPGHAFQRPLFSPDGTLVVALDGARRPVSLTIWQAGETNLRNWQPVTGYYQSVVFRPDTDALFTSYFDSLTHAGKMDYLLTRYKVVPVYTHLEQAETQPTILGFNLDGSQMRYLAHDLNTDEVSHHLWDFETNAEIAPIFTGSADAILSPDWTTAVEIDPNADPAFFLHDLDAGTTTHVTVEADTLSRALIFSPDSQLIGGSTYTGDGVSLRLWAASNGTEVAIIPLGEFDVLEVMFTADMTRLIARIARSMPSTPEPEQLIVWAIP